MKTGIRNGKAAQFTTKYGVFLAFLLIIIVFSIFSPKFLTARNLISLSRQVAFNAILSMGMITVMIGGGIDLSVGSVMALAAMITASCVRKDNQVMPVVPALFIALAAGGACGAVSGVFVSKGRLAPFIVTLSMMAAVRGAAQLYTMGHPISVLSDGMNFLGSGTIAGLPVPVILVVLVALLTWVILNCTRLGRHIFAVGGNEPAAEASGIRVGRVKIFTYVYSGVLAALVGVLLAGRLDSASPLLGTGYETDAIAAAVIGGTSMNGGRGKVVPVLVGALIIGTITNGLDLINVSSYWQQIIKAAIILSAVLLDRSGRNGGRA